MKTEHQLSPYFNMKKSVAYFDDFWLISERGSNKSNSYPPRCSKYISILEFFNEN